MARDARIVWSIGPRSSRRTFVSCGVVVFALLGGCLPPPRGGEKVLREAPSAPALRGRLEIAVEPSGAAIWIDGEVRGITPAVIEGLPFGRAIEVKITKEHSTPHHETIVLTDAQPSRRIEAVMASTTTSGSAIVLLDVTPRPEVWLDGIRLAGSPRRLESVPSGGEHTLVLKAPGHLTKEFRFTARRGETKTFAATLVEIAPTAGVIRVDGPCVHLTINGRASPLEEESEVPAGPAP